MVVGDEEQQWPYYMEHICVLSSIFMNSHSKPVRPALFPFYSEMNWATDSLRNLSPNVVCLMKETGGKDSHFSTPW